MHGIWAAGTECTTTEAEVGVEELNTNPDADTDTESNWHLDQVLTQVRLPIGNYGSHFASASNSYGIGSWA